MKNNKFGDIIKFNKLKNFVKNHKKHTLDDKFSLCDSLGVEDLMIDGYISGVEDYVWLKDVFGNFYPININVFDNLKF
jgi:hypothetical protein